MFSKAELMQTRNYFLWGGALLFSCKKQYSYNIHIYHTSTASDWGQQLAYTGDWRVGCSCSWACKKKKWKTGTHIWLSMLALSISRSQTPSAEEKNAFLFFFFYFISFIQPKKSSNSLQQNWCKQETIFCGGGALLFSARGQRTENGYARSCKRVQET